MIEIIQNWHPALVHFPIAFTTAAVAFVAIGTLFKNRPWTAQCLLTGPSSSRTGFVLTKQFINHNFRMTRKGQNYD